MRGWRWHTACLVVASLGRAGSATAEVDDYEADYETAPAVKRDGFTASLYSGVGFAQANGFPNEIEKIGDPEFEQTAFGLGTSGNIYIGAAIRDWFLFGVGMNFASTTTSDAAFGGGAFMVHLEGYPLYTLGGPWRDLGLYTDMGLGGGAIMIDDEEVALGGGSGLIGLGVVYEAWRWGYLSFAPTVQYSHTFVRSLTSNALSFGIRTAFYASP